MRLPHLTIFFLLFIWNSSLILSQNTHTINLDEKSENYLFVDIKAEIIGKSIYNQEEIRIPFNWNEINDLTEISSPRLSFKFESNVDGLVFRYSNFSFLSPIDSLEEQKNLINLSFTQGLELNIEDTLKSNEFNEVVQFFFERLFPGRYFGKWEENIEFKYETVSTQYVVFNREKELWLDINELTLANGNYPDGNIFKDGELILKEYLIVDKTDYAYLNSETDLWIESETGLPADGMYPDGSIYENGAIVDDNSVLPEYSGSHSQNGFPIERSREEALKKADLEAWEEAIRINKKDSYRKYLKENPTGKYVNEARSKIDTIAKVEQFLDSHIVDNMAANIIQNIPETMLVNKIYTVSIHLLTDTTINSIKKELEENLILQENQEFVKYYPIKEVGRKMRVELIDDSPEGDKNFEITPVITNLNRDIKMDTPSRWAWKVRPLKTGVHKLSLIFVNINPESDENLNDLLNKEIKVTAEVNLKNYIYFSIVLLISVLSLIFFLIKRRKRQKHLKNYFLENKEVLRTLIGENEVERVIEIMLKQRLSRKHKDQLISNKSMFKKLNDEIIEGTINKEDKYIRENKITKSLLKIISDISGYSGGYTRI